MNENNNNMSVKLCYLFEGSQTCSSLYSTKLVLSPHGILFLIMTYGCLLNG